MTKLTKRYIDSIKPPITGEKWDWDSELRGFGVRTFASGRKTFHVQYRNAQGKTKRLKIGVYGPVTADQARDHALEILGEVARGNDPSEEKHKIKKAVRFNELAREYLEIHAKTKKRKSSLRNDVSTINNILIPRFKDKPLNEIILRDIQLLHTEMSKTPYRANRVLALISKMFSLAIQWGWADKNPARGIERYQEQKREVYLSEEELSRLWTVLDEYPNHFVANAIKIIILTGARRGEVLNATWDQFDLEQGIWTKPSHLTKQKKLEKIPLSETAIELLKSLKPQYAAGYIFPGRVDGQPIIEIKRSWDNIRNLAQLPNLRIHDLRHSHASILVSAGLSLEVIGRLLGHTQASTTKRYAHLQQGALKAATEIFASKISRKKDEKKDK
jgi:integrase